MSRTYRCHPWKAPTLKNLLNISGNQFAPGFHSAGGGVTDVPREEAVEVRGSTARQVSQEPDGKCRKKLCTYIWHGSTLASSARGLQRPAWPPSLPPLPIPQMLFRCQSIFLQQPHISTLNFCTVWCAGYLDNSKQNSTKKVDNSNIWLCLNSWTFWKKISSTLLSQDEVWGQIFLTTFKVRLFEEVIPSNSKFAESFPSCYMFASFVFPDGLYLDMD